MRLRLSTALAALLALAACGSTAGSPCTTPAQTTCASSTSLLVCEGGAWRDYACPSCTGSTCTWTNVKNGDACPQTAAGDGWCPYDKRQLSCFFSATADAGVFVEKACSVCVQGRSLAAVGACSGGTCSCQ